MQNSDFEIPLGTLVSVRGLPEFFILKSHLDREGDVELQMKGTEVTIHRHFTSVILLSSVAKKWQVVEVDSVKGKELNLVNNCIYTEDFVLVLNANKYLGYSLLDLKIIVEKHNSFLLF